MNGFAYGFSWHGLATVDAAPAPTPTPVPTPTPAPAPGLVDSVQGGGSAGAASATGLVATGSNRQVFAMVGAGTSDSVSDISCSITGTGGTAAMTRVFFLGTNNETPASALEAFAGFVIEEADLPGDGPYDIDATATGSNVPDKVGIVAGSVQDAPTTAIVTSDRASSGNLIISATIAADDTLVLAGLGSATATSGATMTGATQIENLFSYGDGIQLGFVLASAGSLNVTNNVGGRQVSGLVQFPKG